MRPMELLEPAAKAKSHRRPKSNRETLLEAQQRSIRPTTAVQLCELPLALCTGEGMPLPANKSQFVDSLCDVLNLPALPEAATIPRISSVIVETWSSRAGAHYSL